MGKKPPIGKRFEPGQSGNPNGRPKKLPSLDKLLPEVLGDEADDESLIKKILEATAKRALAKGGDRAAEIILARAFGAPKQTISTDSEITIVVKHDS